MHILLHNLAQTVLTPPGSLPQTQANGDSLKTVLDIVFAVLGAVALLIITLSGFRLVISRGDPQGLARARNTIIYASLGLLICVIAIAIVTFTIKQVQP